MQAVRYSVMIKKIAFLFFFVPVSMLFSDNFTKGKLVYYEGELLIQRNGSMMSGNDIETGTVIEEYDLLKTGSEGYAEILVESSVSDKIIIKIEPDSSLYFTVAKKNEKKNFDIKMLSGNIFLKVSKLAGKGSMNISSKSAVMGIRGTELFINTAPDGSLLVSCPEGSVSCRSGGEEVFAGNGKAVELLYGKSLKTKAVSNDVLDNYRSDWSAEREKVFRSMSFAVIKPSALRYEDLLKRFNTAYKDLKKHNKIFKKYLNAKESFSSSETIKDKITVSPAVINMRSVFYLFEEQFFRIEELKRYHDDIPVKGKIRKKYSISDFMKAYGKKYPDNLEKLAFARAAFKSFTVMEPFGLGPDSLMNDIFTGNPLAE